MINNAKNSIYFQCKQNVLVCVTYSLVDLVLYFLIEYTKGSDFSLIRKKFVQCKNNIYIMKIMKLLQLILTNV